MCGIGGIVNIQGIKVLEIQKMSEILRYRGPDDEGFLLLSGKHDIRLCKGRDTIPELASLPNLFDESRKEKNIAGLMHRRLSIIDLSLQGHQPMASGGNEYFIVFNGEIYNYLELREELIGLGNDFESNSDTEIILASYKQWGFSCVSRFIGMWAFAILDLKTKVLFLSRDRFGIKPLYYTAGKGKISFASEIKALLVSGQATPELDNYKLGEFLLFGNTSDPSGNLFNQIQSLPEGYNLVAPLNNPSDFRLTKYYDLKEESDKIVFDEDPIIDCFHEMFNASIDLHLRSDVPVGVNLSGGLDSSSITAFMARKMNGGIFKTFTAAYQDRTIDESTFAKKVINHFPNIESCFTYPSIREFWDELDTQIWHHDLPFHSTSMYAQWEVMKLAHLNGIKVLLNGQGSDEMLGGYFSFTGLFLLELLKGFKLNTFFNEYRYLRKNYTQSINKAISRSAYAWFPDSFKRLSREKLRKGNSFVKESFLNEITDLKPPEFHAKSFNGMSILSIKHGLQQLLRYEDRISMAFSIESRVPFLDHRIVEYAVALDPAWKIHNGWTKYVLRKSSEPYLPSEIIWRKDKMGFLTPAGKWKKELEKELLKYINSTSHLPFLDRDEISKACLSNDDQPTHISEFWKIIVTMKWAEIFKIG